MLIHCVTCSGRVLFVPAGVTLGDWCARVGSAFEPVDVRRGVYLCTIALYYFRCIGRFFLSFWSVRLLVCR